MDMGLQKGHLAGVATCSRGLKAIRLWYLRMLFICVVGCLGWQRNHVGTWRSVTP